MGFMWNKGGFRQTTEEMWLHFHKCVEMSGILIVTNYSWNFQSNAAKLSFCLSIGIQIGSELAEQSILN